MIGSSSRASIEPRIEALRVAGDRRVEAAPHAASSTTPPRAARGRGDEHLLILFNLNEAASSHLYRELREIVAQTYWSTAGSITAALRRAASAANRYLFRLNLNAEPSGRRYGGLTCAVYHDGDLFILQAGPAWACILRGEHLTHYPRGDNLTHLGVGPLTDVRLYHAFVDEDVTLLLASPALRGASGDDTIAGVLARAEMEDVLAGLEQIGAGVDFAVLVVRWVPAAKDARTIRKALRATRHAPAPAASAAGRDVKPAAEQSIDASEPSAPPMPRQRPAKRRSEVGLLKRVFRGVSKLKPGRRLMDGLSCLGRGLGYLWRGASAVGAWLLGALGTLFHHMLPGRPQAPRRKRRARRPVPEENTTLLKAIAIGLPVLVVIIVVLASLTLKRRARSDALLNQAEEELARAQAAAPRSPEDARLHWVAALDLAEKAATLQPGEPTVEAVRDQAQASLDRLDGITRVTPVQLFDFGSSDVTRRLLVHGQKLFILDPTGGWVSRLTLTSDGAGVTEDESLPVIVRTDQRIGDRVVGELVDFTWVGRGAGRQTKGLLTLEESGMLIGYDPAWESEGGEPPLATSIIGAPPPGPPRAVGSYEGRFYILDVTATDGHGQIWRYMPRDDAYPVEPEGYFATPPPKPLAEALDMAIDGYVYVLYNDGAILKFLGGEQQPFDVHGVPDGLGQAIALAVDTVSRSGTVYVADRGNERIVVLEPDGELRAQLHADKAFDALEALAVDETARRLYVLSGGKLYAVSLP